MLHSVISFFLASASCSGWVRTGLDFAHSTLQPTLDSTCSTSLPLSAAQFLKSAAVPRQSSLSLPGLNVLHCALSLFLFPAKHGKQVLSPHCRCHWGGLLWNLPLAAAGGTALFTLVFRSTEIWLIRLTEAVLLGVRTLGLQWYLYSAKHQRRGRAGWHQDDCAILPIPLGDKEQTNLQTNIFPCTHWKSHSLISTWVLHTNAQVQAIITEVLQAWNYSMNLPLLVLSGFYWADDDRGSNLWESGSSFL